jgi:hypothetical protein
MRRSLLTTASPKSKRSFAAAALLCAIVFLADRALAGDPVLQDVGLAKASNSQPAPTPTEDSGPEPSPAAAEMLKSMREKGLLTEDEYQELYRRQAKYEVNQKTREGVPGWLQDWTFGGDLRLRYERRDFGNLGFGQTYTLGKDNINVVVVPNRGTGVENRARFRLRLGGEKKVVPDLTFGFRIATSTEVSYGNLYSSTGADYSTRTLSDPRSQNVTFGNFFDSKSIFLDRAYLSYRPSYAPTLNVIAGKFANPFVSKRFLDSLIWDNDINPEGVAASYRFDLSPDRVWLDATAGLLTLQELSSVTLTYNSTTNTAVSVLPDIDQQNPYMLAFQGGITGRPDDWVQMGARISYYDLSHIGTRVAAAMEDLGNGGAAISRNPLFRLLGPTNSLFEDGSSQGRTREMVTDAYVNFTPWGERYSMTPFFQYMHMFNVVGGSEDNGWLAGIDLGSAELVRLTVMYASIGRNATNAIFTDSDIFEGFTNAEGWYFAAERQIWRGVRMRGAYMRSRELQGDCALASQSLALCDTASQISDLAPYRKTTLDRQRFQLDLMVDF